MIMHYHNQTIKIRIKIRNVIKRKGAGNVNENDSTPINGMLITGCILCPLVYIKWQSFCVLFFFWNIVTTFVDLISFCIVDNSRMKGINYWNWLYWKLQQIEMLFRFRAKSYKKVALDKVETAFASVCPIV